MTFKWERRKIESVDPWDEVEDDEGEFVRAEDAINREAVNTAEIATLKARLKESQLQLHRVRGHLMRKNRALVEIRKTVDATFGSSDPE